PREAQVKMRATCKNGEICFEEKGTFTPTGVPCSAAITEAELAAQHKALFGVGRALYPNAKSVPELLAGGQDALSGWGDFLAIAAEIILGFTLPGGSGALVEVNRTLADIKASILALEAQLGTVLQLLKQLPDI